MTSALLDAIGPSVLMDEKKSTLDNYFCTISLGRAMWRYAAKFTKDIL